MLAACLSLSPPPSHTPPTRSLASCIKLAFQGRVQFCWRGSLLRSLGIHGYDATLVEPCGALRSLTQPSCEQCEPYGKLFFANSYFTFYSIPYYTPLANGQLCRFTNNIDETNASGHDARSGASRSQRCPSPTL